MKHRPQLNRERKPTFDDEALQKLVKQYKTDLLYPLILQYRNVEKVLGTYIGVWNE